MDLFRPNDETSTNVRMVVDEIQLLRVEISQKLNDLKSEIESFKTHGRERSKIDYIMEPSEYTSARNEWIQRQTITDDHTDEHTHYNDSTQQQLSDIQSIPDPTPDELESETNPTEIAREDYTDLHLPTEVAREDYTDLHLHDGLKTETVHSYEDDQQRHVAVEHSQTMESPYAVTMPDISNECMFGICTKNKIDLYVQDSQFFLYTSYFKPTLPAMPTCKRAFIFTSIPYTRTKVLMIIIRKLMEHFQFHFRSYMHWNWHAHAKIDHRDAEVWTERMSEFLKRLTPTDELIIQAPYKDDKAAKDICETSVVIHEIRPLEDTALLRYHGYQDAEYFEPNEDDTLAKISVAGAVNYVRSMLSHQKSWEKDADVIFSYRKFREDNLLSFARLICLDYMTEQRLDLCTGHILSTIVSSDEVVESMKAMNRHNAFLSNLYRKIDTNKDVNDNSTQIMIQIQNIFLPWINSKIAADML